MINFFFVSRLEVPKTVTAGGALSRSNFFTEVFVEVLRPGCYTVELVLKDRELTGPDVTIGSQQSTTRACFCFPRPLQRRRFHAYGAAAPDPGATISQPSAATSDVPNDELPSLSGRWPLDDGFFSNDLELFVEGSVYLCRAGACSETEGCGVVRDTALTTPLVTRTSDVKVVDLIGGRPFRPIDDIGGAIVGSAPSVGGRLFSEAGQAVPSPPAAGLLASRLADRRLERLARRLRQDLQPAPVDLALDVGSEAVSPPTEGRPSARGGARRGRRSTGA